MQIYDDIPTINRAVRRYLAHAEAQMSKRNVERKLSQDTFERLEKISDANSIVEIIAIGGELLYARRNELDSEGRNLAHGLMMFGYRMDFDTLRTNGERGLRIAQSMARDEGEPAPSGMSWPDPESDPPAKQHLLAAADAPPPVSAPVEVQPPAAS